MVAFTLGDLNIRELSSDADLQLVCEHVIQPSVRTGEELCLPQDASLEELVAYWCAPAHRVFVAEREGSDAPLGSYYVTQSHAGNGAHVAKCEFVTAPDARGRGVARSMLRHALETAHGLGYRDLLLDFVIEVNKRALAIWKQAGFVEVGRLPGAFAHPTLGFVDALVMHRKLGLDDLVAWFREVKHSARGSPPKVPVHESDDEDDLIQPISQFDPERDRLPPPAPLPPPKPQPLPKPVIDPETGYAVDDVCSKIAWYLDSIFVTMHPGSSGRVVEHVPTQELQADDGAEGAAGATEEPEPAPEPSKLTKKPAPAPTPRKRR
jgi:GNAT superfamily N-acetyltransferase